MEAYGVYNYRTNRPIDLNGADSFGTGGEVTPSLPPPLPSVYVAGSTILLLLTYNPTQRYLPSMEPPSSSSSSAPFRDFQRTPRTIAIGQHPRGTAPATKPHSPFASFPP